VRRIVIPKVAFYGALAAALVIAVALFWPRKPAPGSGPTPHRFVQVATVVEQTNAIWQMAGHELAVDKPVCNEPIRLAEGLARLQFANGAEVVLEAPCALEPVTGNEIHRNGGRLVAVCDAEGRKGFIVQAGAARLVDLGTEFGVTLPDNGPAEAPVIRGAIPFAVNPEVEIREGARQ